MSMTLLILILVGFLAAGTIAVLLLTLGADQKGQRDQLRNIVSAQRKQVFGAGDADDDRRSIFETASESKVSKRTSSKLTLQKKLHYARWKISPVAFRISEVLISLLVFAFIRLHFNIVIQFVSLMAGPIVMRYFLNRAMTRRFSLFDSDYPQMIMSMVGLLKTGMNVMGALSAAAEGLEEGSLVKQEVELMVERLRFGVSEDKSIGAFADDVYHPEIELFVQALLLSRRVGGNLSDTLDRLAKQVRKRQYFRSSAIAAVGMQRGSIMFIICILFGLEFYMYLVYPEAITVAVADKFGWMVWQVGLMFIGLGIFWVRQITKIRV